jgi:hypothetical protein
MEYRLHMRNERRLPNSHVDASHGSMLVNWRRWFPDWREPYRNTVYAWSQLGKIEKRAKPKAAVIDLGKFRREMKPELFRKRA